MAGQDTSPPQLQKYFGMRLLRKLAELMRAKFNGRLVLNYHLGRVSSFETRFIEHEEPKR